MSKSKIEWTDATWNPITGCTKLSEGCRNCYAERMSKRLAGRCGYPKDKPFSVTLHPEKLEDPLKWKKPRKIFVNSMSDLFHDDVPDGILCQVFNIMALTQQHTYLILTKRPERMKKFLAEEAFLTCINCKGSGCDQCDNTGYQSWVNRPYPNVWLGVSVENQAAADERIPLLLQAPVAVRFISAEPLLGPVNLTNLDQGWQTNALTGKQSDMGRPWYDTGNLDWVIVGGESGPGARPMHPDWVRSLRDQCQAAGTKFFFKQFGEWIVPEDGAESCRVCGCTWNNACNGGCSWVEPGLCSTCIGKQVPDYRAVKFQRVGKMKAGRELDGRTWDEMPEVMSK